MMMVVMMMMSRLAAISHHLPLKQKRNTDKQNHSLFFLFNSPIREEFLSFLIFQNALIWSCNTGPIIGRSVGLILHSI